MIDFDSLIVALNVVGYAGPLSVEWEDSRMDRVHGATESAAFCPPTSSSRTRVSPIFSTMPPVRLDSQASKGANLAVKSAH